MNNSGFKMNFGYYSKDGKFLGTKKPKNPQPGDFWVRRGPFGNPDIEIFDIRKYGYGTERDSPAGYSDYKDHPSYKGSKGISRNIPRALWQHAYRDTREPIPGTGRRNTRDRLIGAKYENKSYKINNEGRWIESKLNDLQIGWKPRDQSIMEEVETDRQSKKTWSGNGLEITQPPSSLGSGPFGNPAGSFGDKYTPINLLKEELGPTKAPDPQKGSDQINTGSGKFATWRPDNERNQALQIAAAKTNETPVPTPTFTTTTNASKLKISSDVHTIDPATGKPVGVITNRQRRAFEARADVQASLREAEKNNTDIRIYKDRLGKTVIRRSGG